MYINPQTCERCPHRHSKKGCPAWINGDSGFMETNIATGDMRMVTGCFYQVMPRLMSHVVAAANRPAAVLQDMRNDMIGGLKGVAQALVGAPELPALEHKSDGKK